MKPRDINSIIRRLKGETTEVAVDIMLEPGLDSGCITTLVMSDGQRISKVLTREQLINMVFGEEIESIKDSGIRVRILEGWCASNVPVQSMIGQHKHSLPIADRAVKGSDGLMRVEPNASLSFEDIEARMILRMRGVTDQDHNEGKPDGM